MVPAWSGAEGRHVNGASRSPALLVGRESELERLSRAADVATGRAVTVLVSGAPGVGATALAERFTSTLSGATVVWASAARAESGVAYGFVYHLFAVLAAAGADVVGPRAGIDRRSSSTAVVGVELLGAIDRLEAAAPVVLVVDDLEWADHESLAAVRFALRRLGPERVLAICIGRPGQGAWNADLEDWPDAERIELHGLDVEATGELLAGLRGTSPAERVIQKVHEVTGGNPSFIRALCADWSGATDQYLLGRAEVVTSLAGAVGHVLDTLPPGQALVLRVLAVMGGPTDIDRVVDVTGATDAASVDGEGTRAAIDGLRAAGLVRWRSDGDHALVELESAVWAAAIQAVTEATELRRLHAAAAAVTSPPQQWRHLVAAAVTDDPELAARIEAAAADALSELELASAAELLLWARGLPGDEARRSRLLLEAVRLFVYAGRDDQARRLRRDVEDHEPSAARAETLALLDGTDGQLLTARDRLTAARGSTADPVEIDRIDFDLAYTCTLVGLGDGIDSALAGGATFGPGWPEATQSLSVFAEALRSGPAAALDSLAASSLPEEPGRCSPAQLPLLAARGLYRGLTGQYETAIADLTIAARRRSGSAALMGNLPEVHVAWCHLLVGDLAGAARAIEVGLDSS